MTRPFPGSGLGANLASFAGAVWAASRLHRHLLVDWRGMDELRDKDLNYFTTFYEPIDEIDGVRIVYAGASDAPDYTSVDEHLRPLITPDETAELLAAQATRTEPYLVLQVWHGLERIAHAMNERDLLATYATFMRRLCPRPEVATAIETFAERELARRFVVGLNIRTGNGAFKPGSGWENRVDQSIYADRDRFLRHVQAACDRRAAARGDVDLERRILVVTDCQWMHELLMTLPGAVARRFTFPPPGVGHSFADFESDDYTDRDSIVDTIADMHLMAWCDALVYNSTLFNVYARAVTDRFGGNVEHVESRYSSQWVRLARRGKALASRALRR